MENILTLCYKYIIIRFGECKIGSNGRELSFNGKWQRKNIFLTIRGQKRAFRGNNYLEKYCKRYNQFLTRIIIGNIFTTAYTNLGFAIDGQNQTVRDILRETDKTVEIQILYVYGGNNKEMIKIAILDDEEEDLEKEEQITRQYFYSKKVECEITLYQSSEWFLLGLKEEKFDLYILDAEMPGKNGIEVAREIRKLYPEPIIIYITNHLNYAVEAYEVNTYRYIPKDQLKDRLYLTYDALLPALMAREEKYYIIKKRSEIEKIAYSDIFYVKKEGKNVVFVHRNGETAIRESLSTIEKELNSKDFIIVDRGYLANIKHVMKMKNRDLYIRNGEIIAVGRERFKYVRKAILNYWGI